MAISMLKIRRPLGRLIFNMGIAIPGKTVFLIETAPSFPNYRRTHIRQQATWTSIAYKMNYFRRIFKPFVNDVPILLDKVIILTAFALIPWVTSVRFQPLAWNKLRRC